MPTPSWNNHNYSQDKLASTITTEQGKTLKDAFNDVNHGIELVEHACGMSNLHSGDFFSNISNGIDTYSIQEPLGVCTGICSFNFPAMIPLLVCFFFISMFFYFLGKLYMLLYFFLYTSLGLSLKVEFSSFRALVSIFC